MSTKSIKSCWSGNVAKTLKFFTYYKTVNYRCETIVRIIACTCARLWQLRYFRRQNVRIDDGALCRHTKGLLLTFGAKETPTSMICNQKRNVLVVLVPKLSWSLIGSENTSNGLEKAIWKERALLSERVA